jgi:glycosyltransferase involved in cell wall biosynthesis
LIRTEIVTPVGSERRESLVGRLGKSAYEELVRSILAFEKPVASSAHEIFCNSLYTKEATLQAFDLGERAEEVKVLYPPVNLAGFWCEDGAREDRVVSLARFGKGQIEQIEIAKEVPDLTFHIVGAAEDEQYYEMCARLVEELGLDNVLLHRDMPFEEVKALLARSKFFLHNVRKEEFGIAVAESVAAGCVPIVHDSGGPREIVPIERLRFRSKEQAVEILREHRDADLRDLRHALQANVRRFDQEVFAEKLQRILPTLL